MKHINSVFAAVLLVIISTTTSFSQTPVADQVKKLVPNPIPQSPNVAALGQYGTYNVNLYTGLPEISIPIFEAASGNLKAPISLSYHAAGIRYTDQASWVGLGWSLSAGGQISRNTIGKPDEELYYTSGLGTASACSNYYYVKNVANNVTDADADVFSYSFPGKSGKFLLGAHLGSVSTPYYLIPYEPIKLEPEFSSTQFHKFKIIDERGVSYFFGKNQLGTISANETTSSDNGGVNTLSRTAWYLQDMLSPNSNDKINFTYQDVGLAYITDASDRVTVSDLCSGTSYCNPEFISTITETLNVSTVNQKGLDEIIFEGGKVKFILGNRRNDQHASASLKYLDRIEVYGFHNNTYSLQKYYKFIYSYFKNNANTIDLRLKLDELQVFDKNNQLINKYTFNYHTNNFSWDTPTNSKRRDFFGFFNNRSNSSLIPSTQIQTQSTAASSPVTTTIGNANRTTDTTYLKEGVLERITYPTGGYTEFAFEPHQYQESGTQYPGGLRVKRITSYDGMNPSPIVKSYKYGENESGFGNKNFALSSFFFMNEQKALAYNLTVGINITATYNYRIRTYLSSSSLSLDSYDGAPVVYPVVTEYTGSFSSHIGKTVYEYDDKIYEPDQAFVVPLVGKSMKDSRHWKRGKLTKKIVYNSSGQLVSTSITTYQSFQSQNRTVGMGAGAYYIMLGDLYDNANVPACLNEIGESVASAEFQVMNYPQSTGAYRELATTEYIYENGDINKVVSKSSTSQYDATYLQVTQTTQTGGGASENLITKYKYPFSYSYPGSESGTALGIKRMRDNNIISTPIEQYSIKQIGASNYVIGGQVSTFKVSPANTSYISPDIVYMLESNSSILEGSYSATGMSSSALTMDSRYKPALNMFYDINGNITQAQQTNNHYLSYQWGYNNTLAVAEATNAKNDKHTVYNQSTADNAITMGGPTPTVVLNKTFTVDYTGTVYLKLGVSTNPAYTTRVSYSSASPSIGSASNITLTKNISCGSPPTIATFYNVPAGTHTITLTLTTPDSGVSSLGACGLIQHPALVPSTVGITEFFYEGFEEGSATGTATPHTGKKYLIGDYTTTFTKPNARTYTIEYWYLSGGQWTYTATTYTNGMTLTAGDAIDDVRIYPTDARIKTYTYEPGLGITSVLDENGTAIFYQYDSFGRLWQVKNDKGGIEKQYTYNYKSN